MIFKNNSKEILGVISYLKDKNIPLQKIVIQKVFFFLKESGFALSYSFEPYKYGPFSEELSEDLEILESEKKITIDKAMIELKDNNAEPLNANAKAFIDLFADLVEDNYDFDNMEIYGTVFYCIRSLEEALDPINKDTVLKQFTGWKGNKYLEKRVFDVFGRIINFQNKWKEQLNNKKRLNLLGNYDNTQKMN